MQNSWTVQKHEKFPDVERGAQVLVQKVVARTAARGVRPSQASRLRLPRHLSFGHLTVHHIGHPAPFPSLLPHVFYRATVLVIRVCRRDRIDGNRAASSPVLVIRFRRRTRIASLHR